MSTKKATAPLLLRVVTSGARVVPVATLPNMRLLVLTDAATFTVSLFDSPVPFAVPDIVA